MLVISSAELRNNMKKYLDLAKDETVVCIFYNLLFQQGGYLSGAIAQQ